MAADVAHKIRSNQPFYLGVTVANVNKFGTSQRIVDSGNFGVSPEQFTKTTVNDTQLFNKLNDNFDEVRYYQGDSPS